VLVSRLAKSQHVLHVVEPGFLFDGPLRGAKRPARKRVPTARAMRQFEAFPRRAERDRMIADDIADTQRMPRRILAANVFQYFLQPFRRAAGSIFLGRVMGFDDLSLP